MERHHSRCPGDKKSPPLESGRLAPCSPPLSRSAANPCNSRVTPAGRWLLTVPYPPRMTLDESLADNPRVSDLAGSRSAFFPRCVRCRHTTGIELSLLLRFGGRPRLRMCLTGPGPERARPSDSPPVYLRRPAGGRGRCRALPGSAAPQACFTGHLPPSPLGRPAQLRHGSMGYRPPPPTRPTRHQHLHAVDSRTSSAPWPRRC
jgi:hypothetical protein